MIGIAVAIATAMLSVSRHLLPGVFNDDGSYLALGRALARGAGYRSTYIVGSPLQVKFPPGFPALLAIVWRVGHTLGAVQTIATTINIVACGISAALFWWIARERLRLPIAVVATFVVLPFVLDSAVQYYTLVLSEPLFILTMAIAFVLVDRRTMTTKSTIALGATLAIGVFLRTQGIALTGAILLALLLDRSRRREFAIVVAVSILPVVAWQAYLVVASRHQTLSTQASESSYTSFLTGSGTSFVSREISVVSGNLLDYLHVLGGYVAGSDSVGFAVAILAGVLTVVGTILLFRVSAALGLALIANGAMLLAWPAYQDRYLLPILPLAGVAAGYAFHDLARRLFIRRETRSVARWESIAAAVGLVLVVSRQYDIRREVESARSTGRSPSVATPSFRLPNNAWFVDAVSRWTLRATTPSDRIAVVSPAAVWLYTNRQTIPMEIVEPRGAPSVFDVPGRYLASELVTARLTSVLAESPEGVTAREVDAVRSACPSSLQKIDEFSGIVAWRATPGDACVASLDARLRTGASNRKS
jgi:hypothetical protein